MVRTPFLILAAISVMAAGPAGSQAEEQATAEQWILRFDVDGDGKLNLDELKAALTADDPTELSFVRVTRDDQGVPVAVETAIVTFRSPNGDQTVDLIGAIHVADQGYYERLNAIFRDYDAVLYELVADEAGRVPQRGQASDHPVGQIQRGIKTLLDLSFQLDEIDYTPDHLVHADMTHHEFAEQHAGTR